MLFGCNGETQNQTVLLATSTSTQDSGLLDYLLPHFENQTGISTRVIAVGTGKALRMAQDGDIDMILVHAKVAEMKFIQAGYGTKRVEVMYNDFVIVGPKNDPAKLMSLNDINAAMQALDQAQSLFISRGDNSGTHIKEKQLWANAILKPIQKYYRETGQGMGKTLQIANEMQAYTLADRATWLSQKDRSSLKIVFDNSPSLQNQYSVILVNPDRYSNLNTKNAQKLITWLTSQQGQLLIGKFKIQGQVLFKPNAAT